MGLNKLPKSGQGPRHEKMEWSFYVWKSFYDQQSFSRQLIQKFYLAQESNLFFAGSNDNEWTIPSLGCNLSNFI